MKKSTWIVGGIILVIIGIFVFRTIVSAPTPVSEDTVTAEISYTKKDVTIGNSLFTLEIANTPVLRERGLSYRESLAQNTGMLFVFDTPSLHYFWMKDMNFPIDVIWLDQDKKVVHIEHSLSPSTYPKSFGPHTNTQYVIELSAGEAKRSGLTLGNTVKFDFL